MRGEQIFLGALAVVTIGVGAYWYQSKSPSAPLEIQRESKTTAIPNEKKSPVLDPKMTEQAGARHILIQYQGTPKSKTSRSKEEAKVLAEKIFEEVKAPGADFAALASKYSEDPSAKKGGDLGVFPRFRMVKPFGDALYAVKPGELVPTIVETIYGFHIILRTE